MKTDSVYRNLGLAILLVVLILTSFVLLMLALGVSSEDSSGEEHTDIYRACSRLSESAERNLLNSLGSNAQVEKNELTKARDKLKIAKVRLLQLQNEIESQDRPRLKKKIKALLEKIEKQIEISYQSD